MQSIMFRNIEQSKSLYGTTPVDVALLGLLGLSQDTVSLPNTVSGKIICGFTIYDAVMVFVILMFVAYIRDQKVDGEIQPVFIPYRPPNGFRKYAVLFETGQSPGGGTTSVIFIRLIGKLTKSPAFSLSWSNEHGDRHLFWSQNKDMFIIAVPHYLGYIEEVEIMTDKTGDSPPWFLKSIRIMSLDNNKCWKTTVNAWLRGDRKPFTFKTYLIGALSTREYVIKVFLQNHTWTMMWWRKLGSYFTCTQRCSIQWCSFAIAMYVAHWMMHVNPYDAEVVAGFAQTPVEFFVRGNDSFLAGVTGAAIGAGVGLVLRLMAREMASCAEWARVDDKDDFGHVMDQNRLSFTEGSVVRVSRPKYTGPKFPYPPCIEDDSVRDILESLTSQQRAALKKMAKCSKKGCGIQHLMNTNECCDDSLDEAEIGFMDDDLIEEKQVEGENASLSLEESTTDHLEYDHMMADKRGFRKSILNMMGKSMKQPYGGDKNADNTQRNNAKDREGTYLGNMRKTIFRGNNLPTPSSGDEVFSGGERRKKFVKKRKTERSNSIPLVSARAEDNLSFLSESMITAREAVSAEGQDKNESNNDFDSLSEPESDEDIVTKFTRTVSEINLRRRAQYVYEGAPLWDDRNRVYVNAPIGNHRTIMKNRYAQTAVADMACCQATDAAGEHGEQAIHSYLNAEKQISPGSVNTNGGGASGVGALASLVAFVLPFYILYQRLVLPDAHGLYYLYAVVLCFLAHALFFCTVDAFICAVLATWSRRRRVAKARKRNSDFENNTLQ